MPTNEERCHFRHAGYLRSAASGSSYKYLTAAINSSAVPTGSVTCEVHPASPTNQLFWIYTDTISHNDPGVGFVGSIMDPNGTGATCHDIKVASASSTTPTIDFSSTPSHAGLSQFYFVESNRVSGGFEIIHRMTDRALTAGSSASDNTLSSTSVSCYLVANSHALNQIWLLDQSAELMGCLQLAPALADDMAILSPGQSSQNKLPLGIGTYDDDDETSVWSCTPISTPSGSSLVTKSCPQRPAYAGAESDAEWVSMLDAGSGQQVQQVRRRARADGSSLSYSATASVAQADTPTGTYLPRRYFWEVSGQALSSSDGQQELAASPYSQTLNASTGMDNSSQFWYAFPRNLYNASLPTPSDIRVMVTDEDTGETRELKQLDQFPFLDAVTITPKFRCDYDDYVSVMRIRYLRSSQYSSSASWGPWEVIAVPESGILDTLSKAPWATPSGPQAWIANSWSGEQDYDGYTTLSSGFSLPSGLFSAMNGAVAQVSITIRAFSYGEQTSYAPALPYEGPAATFTAIIAPKPRCYISPQEVTPDGIRVRYVFDSIDRSIFTNFALRINSIEFSGWYDSDNVMTEPYEASIFPHEQDQYGRYVGDIIVPMTYLSPDDMPTIISELGHYGSAQAKASGVLISQFGQISVEGSQGQSSSISLQTGMVASAGHITTQLGQFATIYGPRNPSQIPNVGWQRISTERGPRYINMPISMYDEFVARHMVGSYVSPDDPQQEAILFSRQTGGETETPLYEVVSEQYSVPLKLTTLSYAESGVLYVIPLQGQISISYGVQRDVSTARRLGGRKFVAGSIGGEAPSISFSGTIFRNQFTGVAIPTSENIKILTSIHDLYDIPENATLMLRTPFGQAHMVRLTGIDSPRTSAGYADITLSMVEVDE